MAMSEQSTSGANVLLGESVDASMSRRPGVPMEMSPPHAMGAAHWAQPERQRDPGNILKRKGLRELTPVFGTSTPPRGLSGLLRRAAYRIPEHATSHWLLLLFADRVDVIEHRPLSLLPLALPLVAGSAGVLLLNRRRRSNWLSRLVRR
jgi:hypothetical protein